MAVNRQQPIKRQRIINGSVLRQLRHIFGYNTKTMSSKLNISQPYLSEIENNKKNPSPDVIDQYAKVFGIRKSSLMLLSEEYEAGSADDFIRKLMIKLINAFEAETIRARENERK